MPAVVELGSLGGNEHFVTSVYAIIFALAIWSYAALGIHTRKAFLSTFGALRVDRQRISITIAIIVLTT